MKIRDQRQRTLKDQMVRRVLKDNKVPGTRVAEAPGWGTGSAAGFLGCVGGQVLLWTWGCLNRRNFSKRKRKIRGTQRLFRELSTAAVAFCAPTPSAPGL